MNWDTISFDWNQVRAFLATVEEGSLSAAARALGQTQPTLSRQISALEENLNISLFERGHRGIKLTTSGTALLEFVRTMGEAASQISLIASGQSQSLEGRVAITASDALAAYVLPSFMKKLKEHAPGIAIDIIASNEVHNLNRREADIAVRHVQLDRPDLISRLVQETTAHLYAAKNYLDLSGRPRDVQALADLDFVGFETPERLLETFSAMGISLKERNFKTTASNGVVMYELVKLGFGVGVLPTSYAETVPELECVLPQLAPVPLPVWLVTHRELYNNRRVRCVFDWLEQAFMQEQNELTAGA